jgi:peptidoglycan/LPS O-acetylase OafA/YrhL
MSHFHANSMLDGSMLLDRGSIYVDFFFVLSGFVIFASYGERLKSGYGVSKFVFLRFGRLYPLHIAVFIAFILVDVSQLFIHIDGAALHEPFSGPGESIKAMVANVFLVHSMGILDRLSFNGPSWSISVEFYTYILFAFIITYTGRFSLYVVSLCALISVMMVFTHSDHLYAKLDYGFFRCVYGFSCGVLTWEIYKNWGHQFQEFIKNKFKANILEFGCLVLAMIYIHSFSFDKLSFFAPIVFSAVVFLFAFEGGFLSDILKKKVFLFLGMLSYSIYMTHIFISGKLFALPVRMLESKYGWEITGDIGGVPHYGANIITGTAIELFYLLTVICCSYISFKLIEDPFRKLSKKFIKSRERK